MSFTEACIFLLVHELQHCCSAMLTIVADSSNDACTEKAASNTSLRKTIRGPKPCPPRGKIATQGSLRAAVEGAVQHQQQTMLCRTSAWA
jgi:hypothetical protein